MIQKLNSKYPQKTVLQALDLVKKNVQVRTISRMIGVPETTIHNWKGGNTNLFGTKRKLTNEIREEILYLRKKGFKVKEISKTLELCCDDVRRYLKETLSIYDYGQLLTIGHQLPTKAKIMTPDLAYILGVLYGDGFFTRDGIGLGTKDKEFRDYFADTAERWAHKKVRFFEREQHGRPYYECKLNSLNALKFIRDLVGNRVEVPSVVFNSSRKVQIGFIRGFYDSEGCVLKNPKIVRVYNTNQKVIEQIKEMLVTLGFDEKRTKVRLHYRRENGKDMYVVAIANKQGIKMFYELIGFTINRKQERLKSILF